MKNVLQILCSLFVGINLCFSYKLPPSNSKYKRGRSALLKEPPVQKSPLIKRSNIYGLRGGAITEMPTSPFQVIEVVPLLGTILTNAMYIAALPSIQMFRKQESMGTLNMLPFSILLINSIAWTIYSVLVQNPYIFWSSGPGILFGLYLFSTGLRNGSPFQQLQLEKSVLIFMTILLSFYCICFLNNGLIPIQTEQILLNIATACSILYYLAPFSTLREILRTKNADSIYVPMSLMGFINSMLWLVYGMSLKNKQLSLPNGFGAFLSASQVVVAAIFSSPNNVTTTSSS